MPYPATPCDLVPDWAGEFDTFQNWVNKAPGWIDGKAICVDALGRRCLSGGDFMRARDENAFPVRFFWECKSLYKSGGAIAIAETGGGVADKPPAIRSPSRRAGEGKSP